MKPTGATLGALFSVGVLLVASAAEAQEQTWLRDRRFTYGEGVAGEKLVYQAGVSAAMTYDSNVFLRSGTADEPLVDAFRLSITPVVGVMSRKAPEGQRNAYQLNGIASISYFEFFKGLRSGDVNSVNEDLGGHRNVGVVSALSLTIAPGERWSGQVSGGLIRSIQPSNLGDPSASYNRTVPNGAANLTWTPGGGLFVWRLVGYELLYNYFEAERFQRYSNMNHAVSSQITWRFLPRTSVFSESRVQFIRYTSNETEQSNGDAVTTRFGANGLVTNGLGFLVAAGWSSTFFDARPGSQVGPQDFDKFIAQAEARFYLSTPGKEGAPGVHPSQLAIGYMRDWTQSFVGNFYGRDRGYANFSYFIDGRWLANASAGIARLSFPQSEFANGQARNAAFSSLAADAGGFIEYRPSSHLGVNLGVQYSALLTEQNIRGNISDPKVVDQFWWTRVEGTLGLRYLL